MAIQMRRGLLANYDEDKMVAGELAVTTDSTDEDQQVYVAFAPGTSKRILTETDLDSPALTGTPTAPTAAEGTNSTQIATTEFVQNAIEGITGLTEEIKQALLQLAQKVAYIDEHGQTYYNDLYDALYGITAVRLNRSSLVMANIGSTSQLIATTAPAGGTVTWASSDTSVATVDSTGLVTSVSLGSCTITATAGRVSATCAVSVVEVTLVSIDAVYTQSGTVYDTAALDDLKTNLVVTASWSSGTTSEVASSDYSLSGTLTVGTSVVTVTYGECTDTFTVNVSAAPTLSSISAVYTQSGTVYDTDSLDSLKDDLVVTAHYSDSTTQTVTGYTLSGTLTVGTSAITVAYGGQTATFNVTVSEHSDVPAGYTSKNYIQSSGNAYIDTGKQEDYRVTSGFWGAFEVSAVSVNKDLFGYQGIHASSAMLSTYRFLSVVSSSTGNLWYYGAESGASAEISGWNSAGVNDVTVDLTSGNYPVFTVNGVETTGNKKKTQGYNANQGTIYLMAQNHSGNGATTADQTVDGGYIRCYGFKIFENGSTVRDYKPCTRDSDGVAGFYDTVTAAFYPSIGENAFTAG